MTEKTYEQKVEENKKIVNKMFKKSNLLTKVNIQDIIIDTTENGTCFHQFDGSIEFNIDGINDDNGLPLPLWIFGVRFKEDTFLDKKKINCYAIITCEDKDDTADENGSLKLKDHSEIKIELDYNRLLRVELCEVNGATFFEVSFIQLFLKLRVLQRINSIRKHYFKNTPELY